MGVCATLYVTYKQTNIYSETTQLTQHCFRLVANLTFMLSLTEISKWSILCPINPQDSEFWYRKDYNWQSTTEWRLYVRPAWMSSALPYYILNVVFHFRGRQYSVTQSKEILPPSWAVGVDGVDIIVPGAFVGPGPGPGPWGCETVKPPSNSPYSRVNTNFVNVSP
jgi:hypothetical protein